MTLTFPFLEGGADVHMAVLKAICGPTEGKSMIDLCCGHAPFTSKLGFSNRTYVDIQDRKLDDPNEQQFWRHGHALDATGEYDVAFCLDGIEHFRKYVGLALIEVMLDISKKVVLFTPLGECGSITKEGGHPDTHKSAWRPNDFKYDRWSKIVFQNYHPTLGCGAFYFFHCENLEAESKRVGDEIVSQSIFKNQWRSFNP